MKNITSILLRISYIGRLYSIKCESLNNFLPINEEDYVDGHFKFSEENAEINGFPEAQLILDRMKEKTNEEELKKLLEINLSQHVQLIEVLIQCLLQLRKYSLLLENPWSI